MLSAEAEGSSFCEDFGIVALDMFERVRPLGPRATRLFCGQKASPFKHQAEKKVDCKAEE